MTDFFHHHKNNILRTAVLILFAAVLLMAAVRQPKLKTGRTSRASSTENEFDEGDYTTMSEKELLVFAYDGDAEAAYRLGVLYDYGSEEVSQSFDKARHWYEAADMAGNPKAACALGYLYLNGCGVDADLSTASLYFERAVSEGNPEGHVGLGRAALEKYKQGEDTEKEAFRRFRKAKKAGVPDAYYYLGYLKEKGIGTKKNPARAAVLYNKAIKMAGDGTEESFIRNAAHTRLGILFMKGIGVEKNPQQAQAHFYEAAANGYTMGLYYMGICYETGYGVDQDYNEALNYYEQAAQKDYAPALNQIGYMYYNGIGVGVDYEQAVYYQKLAAALGFAKAQVNLGYLYENGYGVEEDLNTALSYYQMAKDQGYSGADEAIARVRGKIGRQAED